MGTELGNRVGVVSVKVYHSCVNESGWHGEVKGKASFYSDGLGNDEPIHWGEDGGSWKACHFCGKELPPLLRMDGSNDYGGPSELDFGWHEPKEES